jgi:Family of unknown function (DUF6252)
MALLFILKKSIMKKLFSLFSYIPFLICISCCETEAKKNALKETFSCTINGEEFYPKNLGSRYYYVGYQKNIIDGEPSYFSVRVESDRLRFSGIGIQISSTKKSIDVGEYILNKQEIVDSRNSSSAKCTFQEKGVDIMYAFYNTTNEATGTVNITAIDAVQKTITGTFQFIAINDLQQKVSVQNGKFNTKYE